MANAENRACARCASKLKDWQASQAKMMVKAKPTKISILEAHEAFDSYVAHLSAHKTLPVIKRDHKVVRVIPAED